MCKPGTLPWKSMSWLRKYRKMNGDDDDDDDHDDDHDDHDHDHDDDDDFLN